MAKPLGFATTRDGISTKKDNIKLPLRLVQFEFSQRGPNISPGVARPPPPPPHWLRYWLITSICGERRTSFQSFEKFGARRGKRKSSLKELKTCPVCKNRYAKHTCIKVLSHRAIFLATCNAILLLIDVKLANTRFHQSLLRVELRTLQATRKFTPCDRAFSAWRCFESYR